MERNKHESKRINRAIESNATRFRSVFSVTDHGQAPEKSQAPSIAYMQAQANLKIAEGIAAGKVNTIVVPVDFKGMVNVK